MQDRESEVIREPALRGWDEVMCTRRQDPKTGAQVLLLQPVHQQALSGHVGPAPADPTKGASTYERARAAEPPGFARGGLLA